MDIRERINDPEETIRAAIEQHMSRVWTSAPVRVVSYDAGKQTVSLQVTTKAFIKQEDGSQKAVDVPVLQDVRVQFPAGGGQTMTFPIAAGDEGLAVFTTRSPDGWQQSGSDSPPPDASVASLSNGFFIPGVKSDPKALSDVSTSATEIRSDDGNTKISLSGAGGVGIATDKAVGIAAAQGVNIGSGAGETAITGTVRITGELIVNDIVFSTHKHAGVQPGGGTSTGPTN